MTDSIDQCRLLVHAPAAGEWNMAVDEALLESAAAGGSPTLRFYQWREPTLSLGYFQRYADRWQHTTSRDCRVVRRTTGGGAILHDRELTYSLCVPPGHRLTRRPAELYNRLHRALVRALAPLGADSQLLTTGADRGPRSEPFLCFARRAAGDVVLAGAKIAGSAQRRHRGAILQHGSVLVATSPAAPELPGLERTAQLALAPEKLIELWRVALVEELQLDFTSGELTAEEDSRAAQLAREKFATAAWNEKR
ncbi:MAG: lipoate--protein ligase family protein [Pirellulales bacterium]|nr:lipoate--protein ligase family protein [Pirellulales bacterium]